MSLNMLKRMEQERSRLLPTSITAKDPKTVREKAVLIQ